MINLLITGGRLVLPNEVVEADIAVCGGVIVSIGGSAEETAKRHAVENGGQLLTVEAEGCYVLPGLVDIHCDAIEKEVQPRPNTLFPLEMAFIEFERKLPMHGITSMYHSLSLGVGLSLRGDHLLTQMIELIHQYRSLRAMVRHGIHLRYEVAHLAGLPIVERFVREKAVDYLSFMDHSPGQGQYKEPGSFERYVMKNQGVDVKEVAVIVQDLLARQEQVNWAHLKNLGQAAMEMGISVASHDDDSPERIRQFSEFGVTVSEFPMNMETARFAREFGLHVCVGAPNVVRGSSHDKNLRAADAIAAGAANILCSDYHPASLLAAVFKLAAEDGITLPDAMNMASLNPANALGAARSIGSIEVGKQGDLLLVNLFNGYPSVTQTIVAGTVVYQNGFYYNCVV